uniref:Uncharacterized protein n=1 Tax=Tetraselmis sp. GSL018 TaxID=582737 RepID=A0A061SPA6_9CHLO|eukprot:CAMPEP_0177578494 /NCGR_PEP_ID=MMETSP0419_2-20121207/378_1 /TAXON_ID=582737 /ORGANISM="Tetraselmis sp., Strain GSL018" /LENGTH=178 /DNA_ID=CAMNT_0019066941 /DNA_START=97 /DNA_END=633 /DNA_ORIENTATION=-
MSETCWKRQPTTVGRGIYSQYKPEHLKEWIERDDRRQQKGLYGSIPVEPLGHLTSYRDSLYKQTPAPRLEKLHNANSKSLAELRKLWAVGSGAIPTAATEDGTTIPRTRRNEDSNKNRKSRRWASKAFARKLRLITYITIISDGMHQHRMQNKQTPRMNRKGTIVQAVCSFATISPTS